MSILPQRQAIAKAMDLSESNIELEVLPIQQEGVNFDFTLFYKVMLSDIRTL